MNARAHKQQAENHERAADARNDAAARCAEAGQTAMSAAHAKEARRHEQAANEHREAATRLEREQTRSAYGDAIANRFRRVVGGAW